MNSVCVVDGNQDSSKLEGLVWKQLKSIVGHDAPPASMLVDLEDPIATKFLPPVIQEFRYSEKDFVVFGDSHELHLISLICDRSVTTQNFAFSSYWCRKRRLQMHF
jgi:hypothetical protein